MRPSVISIKIGACESPDPMPTRTLLKVLEDVGYKCNIARNAMVEHWRSWRKENPDWVPQQRFDRNGQPAFFADGKPKIEHKAISQATEKALYYAGREVVPDISSNLISHCSKDVQQWLKGKTPWDFCGKSKYRWEAVLAYEMSVPTWRHVKIPAPNKDLRLTEDGRMRFALLSKLSGFKVLSPVVRLEVRQMTPGRQRLYQKCVSGELKLADSAIIYKDGKWFFQMTYHPGKLSEGLDKDKHASLYPARDGKRPFELDVVDSVWKLGDGIAMEAEYRRVLLRRKTMRARYRSGSARGHGRKRFYAPLRRWSRAFIHIQDRFRKQMVSRIVQDCLVSGCGTLDYYEPSMPLREQLWFAQRGTPFDWTKLENTLGAKLEQNGIKLNKQRMKMKEHQIKYRWGKYGKENENGDCVAVQSVRNGHGGNGKKESPVAVKARTR